MTRTTDIPHTHLINIYISHYTLHTHNKSVHYIQQERRVSSMSTIAPVWLSGHRGVCVFNSSILWKNRDNWNIPFVPLSEQAIAVSKSDGTGSHSWLILTLAWIDICGQLDLHYPCVKDGFIYC